MSSPALVSDTSPLINLTGIGYLDLLPRLYGAVSIPRAVLTEYEPGKQAHEPDLATQAWLTVVDTVAIDPALPGGLGSGEQAVISLAKLSGARLVLIDEERARNVARQLGLHVVGALSVLLRAKQHGLIPAVNPAIETMIGQGRYFAPTLLAKVLHAAGDLEASWKEAEWLPRHYVRSTMR